MNHDKSKSVAKCGNDKAKQCNVTKNFLEKRREKNKENRTEQNGEK